MNQDTYERLVAREIAGLGERARDNDRLAFDGRLLNVQCLIGTPASAQLVSIRDGRIVETVQTVGVMPSWEFAYRANARAWIEFWQPMPKAGWHDLLALTKRGEAMLEGNLHPFMSRLQYFKDLFSLPRGHVGART